MSGLPPRTLTDCPSLRMLWLPAGLPERLLRVDSAFTEASLSTGFPTILCTSLCPHPPTHRSGHLGNGKVNVEQPQNLQTVEA